jgi:hypothetical protein
VALYLPEELRIRIDEADRGRCQYCLTTEDNSGIRLTYDHIIPRSKGGATSFENVCLACSACNEHKGGATLALDGVTGEVVPLFHPRAQRWSDHFAWSADATFVEGLTATGRATLIALRMNHPRIVVARGRWARMGWHPPADS